MHPTPYAFTHPLVEQVPVDDYTLPMDEIEELRPGTDITVVSFGTPLYTCRALDQV